MGVTWGRSFRGALMIAVYSLVWSVLGVVLIVLGSAGIASGKFPSLAGGFIITVIGVFVVTLGLMASFLKVQTNILADEVEKRLKSPTLIHSGEIRDRNRRKTFGESQSEGWIKVTVTQNGPFKTIPSGSARYKVGFTVDLTANPGPSHPFEIWTTNTDMIEIADPYNQETTATLKGPGIITANFSSR